MIIVNLKTGDPMSFDTRNLPDMQQISGFESLYLNEEIDIDSIYSVVDLFVSAEKETGKQYFYEKEAILLIIDRCSSFNSEIYEDNRAFLLSLYIQYVIGLNSCPIPLTLKNLYLFCISLNEKLEKEDQKMEVLKKENDFTENKIVPDSFKNFINDKEISLFVDKIDAYCKKPGSICNRKDIFKYKMEINKILGELKHPLVDSLRGIFLLHEGNIDKACSSFLVEPIPRKKNSWDDEPISEKKKSRFTEDEIFKLKNSEIRKLGLEITNVYRNKPLAKNTQDIVFLFNKLVNTGNGGEFTENKNEEYDRYLSKILEKSYLYKKVSLLGNSPDYVSEQNISEIFDVVSDSFYHIFKRGEVKEIRNITEKLVDTILNVGDSFSNESVINILNFIIGKIYHIIGEHVKAKIFYIKSDLYESKINLMCLYPKNNCPFDLNIKMGSLDLLNLRNRYCLENNIRDKIVVFKGIKDYDIYKTKKEENWSGNSIINYFDLIDNNFVDQNVVINNLAYFYFQALRENEKEMIEKLFDRIKNRYPDILKIENTNLNENLVNYDKNTDMNDTFKNIINKISLFIASNLYKLDKDSISLYNLSFFVKKRESIRLLESIKNRHLFMSIRLGIEKECLETFENLMEKDKAIALTFIAHHHSLNKNTRMSIQTSEAAINEIENKRDFSSKNEENNFYFNNKNECYLYNCISLGKYYMSEYKIANKSECIDKSIKYFMKGLKQDKNCFYCVVFLALIFYEKKDFSGAILLCKEILKDISKKIQFRNTKNFVNKILGSCYVELGLINEAMGCFYNSGDVELVKKMVELTKNNDMNNSCRKNNDYRYNVSKRFK